MSLAAAVLGPVAFREMRRGRHALAARISALTATSGLFLAGHFILWTASLAYTSVAASTLLVSLHPLFVAPLERAVYRERLPLRAGVGAAVALVGTAVTCAGDFSGGSNALVGDLMAIAGAACLAGYLMIGRGLRDRVGVAGYSWTAYVVVAIVAAVFAGALRTAHMPDLRTFALGAALAIVCTLGGHTVYNWALKRASAMTVSLAFLGEPPLTAVLAFVLLSTAPNTTTGIGGVAILAGLALVLLSMQAARQLLLEPE